MRNNILDMIRSRFFGKFAAKKPQRNRVIKREGGLVYFDWEGTMYTVPEGVSYAKVHRALLQIYANGSVRSEFLPPQGIVSVIATPIEKEAA